MRKVCLAATAATMTLVAGLLPGPAAGATVDPASQTDAERQAPALRVAVVASGLSIPWDVQPIGKGRLLVTERDSARLTLIRRGHKQRVRFPSRTVWRSAETGLMSLAVDPAFASNRRIYTCQGGFRKSGGHDVRVIAWRLNKRATAVRKPDVLVRGIHATTGLHGGCRLLIARNGALLVGTGDAFTGSNPRNLTSLAGKVLRLDRMTGRPWPGNPFVSGQTRAERLVFTYGHRNVQGLVQRPSGSLWSVEHGPDRDDEINRLVAGGDYGWNPVPGYNQSVPMTDHGLPGQQRSAVWSSGSPTVATSGAAWVTGKKWGSLRGRLAVAALKGSRMLFFRIRGGEVRGVRVPAALRQYGRLRSITRTPNGNLLVTTSNGGGRDLVLRVSPR
jgi:aldose sugar dehydrogenase